MTQPALEPRFNFHRKKTPVTDMAHFRPLNAPHHPAFQGHAPGEQERDEATMKLWYTLTRMADGDTAYDPRTVRPAQVARPRAAAPERPQPRQPRAARRTPPEAHRALTPPRAPAQVHRLTSHLHPDEAREADLALARVAALLRRAEAVEGELASVYHEKLPRLEDRANEADERAKELEAQIADRNATVLRLEGRLADATQDVAHAHAELHAEFEARQGAERQIAELERLLAASNSATETLRGELGELRAQARQMNVVTEDLKFSVMDLKARANEAAGAQRKAEAAQAKAEFEASETMAELEHLRDMLEEQMANAADGEAGGEGEQSFGGSFSSKKGGGARRRSDADRAQARRAQEAKALGMQKQVDEALARAEAAQAERDEAKAELKRRAATEALAEERAAQVVLLHHTVEDLGEQLRDVEAQRDALVEEMEELRRINLEATEHADIEKDKKIAYLQHEVEQHQVVALEQTRNAEAALQAIGELRGIEAAQAAPPPPPPPSSRTKWSRRVPHPVPIGHAASLTPYYGGRNRGRRSSASTGSCTTSRSA